MPTMPQGSRPTSKIAPPPPGPAPKGLGHPERLPRRGRKADMAHVAALIAADWIKDPSVMGDSAGPPTP